MPINPVKIQEILDELDSIDERIGKPKSYVYPEVMSGVFGLEEVSLMENPFLRRHVIVKKKGDVSISFDKNGYKLLQQALQEPLLPGGGT